MKYIIKSVSHYSCSRWCIVMAGLFLVACPESSETDSDGGPDTQNVEGTDGGLTDAGENDATISLTVFENARITSIGGEPNFQTVTNTFDLGPGPYAQVMLYIELDSTCYPFEEWTTPPEGHNWPADCDAFDRNFEISVIPDNGSEEPVTFELVRAITPFGGPMQFEQDVTDFFNALPGAHTMKVHITTWSDGSGQVSGSAGGWNVSAHLEGTKRSTPTSALKVISLFNGSVGADTTFEEIEFEFPEGTTLGIVEYRVTGHGGGTGSSPACIGPAEEFCKRMHRVFVDSELVYQGEPWNASCDRYCTLAHYGPATGGFDYCEENPCGAISSVQAPRANWCPGSVTFPIVIVAPALMAPGSHQFRFEIDDIVSGGSWRVSATAYAFGS
jgi:hypothetical protein